MEKNKLVIIAIIVAVFVVVGLSAFNIWSHVIKTKSPSGLVTTNTPAVSYPTHENIVIDLPLPSEKLKSPLIITGRAKTWYFEGSFPIELKDIDGNILTTGIAQAQGDWMTSAFVPFKATLVFAKPQVELGTLTFKKDNPSGLPEFDEQLSVPVTFDLASWSAANPPVILPPCQAGGCSGQLCTDDPSMATTCEWREEYACYKTATCARGTDGKCGWVPTEELNNCLAAPAEGLRTKN